MTTHQRAILAKPIDLQFRICADCRFYKAPAVTPFTFTPAICLHAATQDRVTGVMLYKEARSERDGDCGSTAIYFTPRHVGWWERLVATIKQSVRQP